MVQLTPFHAFKSTINPQKLPAKFPFLYAYEPHELCRMAGEELQDYLLTKTHWNQLLGLNGEYHAVGKMFGVLVVQQADGSLGYLAGYSGAIDACNSYPDFVPPVYDLLNPNGFFKQGEQELNALNEQIEGLEKSPELASARQQLDEAVAGQEQADRDWKQRLKAGKKQRKQERVKATQELAGTVLENRLDELNRMSQLEKIAYKKAQAEWKARVARCQEQLDGLLKPLQHWKQERKEKSAQLQYEIFEQFQLLNSRQEAKSVPAIFREQGEDTPPAGTGDCAGPKLLQYAFQHHLKPIALAEFWWGASPRSEVRKHKQFYPPCRSKCAPLMKHMLQYLEQEPDPLYAQMKQPEALEVLYEDEWLLVVNKPEQFLSVPGKELSDSVQQRIKQMRPEATGPLLVHRLDMSTSGLLLAAKDPVTHKALQSQFMKRITKKRYLAILDGILEAEQGVIDLPLRVDLDNRPRQLVCYEYGKAARTRWEVVARENGRTRVYFYPITGRTHQLRVHAAHPQGLNTAIVGDELYGKPADRLYLHAAYLQIIHPQTGKEMAFEAPDPF